jgi:hypothetical protein
VIGKPGAWRRELKYPALFLLASALVVACASELMRSIDSTGDVPTESAPNTKHSSDSDEMTLGDSDKALRDNHRCALERNG